MNFHTAMGVGREMGFMSVWKDKMKHSNGVNSEISMMTTVLMETGGCWEVRDFLCHAASPEFDIGDHWHDVRIAQPGSCSWKHLHIWGLPSAADVYWLHPGKALKQHSQIKRVFLQKGPSSPSTFLAYPLHAVLVRPFCCSAERPELGEIPARNSVLCLLLAHTLFVLEEYIMYKCKCFTKLTNSWMLFASRCPAVIDLG